MRDTDRVADTGEAAVLSLCAENGWEYTQPGKDRHGWDGFVEFNRIRGEGLPADVGLEHVKMFIQVKSTQGEVAGEPIKLDNASEFLNFAGPCFFAFVHINDRFAADRIFLTPFDQHWQERTLRTLRNTDTEKIASRTITIAPKPEDELTQPWAECMKDRVGKEIGASFKEYRRVKQDFVDNNGYETYRHRGTMVIEGTPKDFVRASLGYEHVLIGRDVKLELDVRYNIAGSIKRIELPVEIKFEPKGEPAKLEFYSPTVGTETFDVSVIVPQGLVGKFRTEDLGCRIKGKFFDLGFMVGDNQLNMTLKPDDATLDELAPLAHVTLMFDEPQKMRVTCIRSNGDRIQLPLMEPGSAGPSEAMRGMAKLIDDTDVVFRHFNLNRKIYVDFERIQELKVPFPLMRQTIQPQSGIPGHFTIDITNRLETKRVAFPLSLIIPISGKLCGLLTLWRGEIKGRAPQSEHGQILVEATGEVICSRVGTGTKFAWTLEERQKVVDALEDDEAFIRNPSDYPERPEGEESPSTPD